jgi:hypothetical protein
MAVRQRKPPQQRTVDDSIRELRDITGRLTNPQDPMQRQAIDRLRREAEGHLTKPPEQREREGITPEQTERLRRALEGLNDRVRDIQNPRPAPRPGQVSAPRRVFNYDVTIGPPGPDQRTFRVTLMDRLPPGRESQMLLDMAKNHEFFEPGPAGVARVTTPGVPRARAEVTQLSGPGTQEFNNMQNNGRVDNFEVALNRAGETTPPAAITVVAVSPQPQTRPRGG